MNRLWRALTRNLILKFAALVCAVVLWVYVDGFVPAERTMRLRVGVRAWEGHWANVLSPDGKPTGRESLEATVTIRGPSRRVRLVEPGQIFGHVKLERPAPPYQLISALLGADCFSLFAEDIAIMDIDPTRFGFQIEKGSRWQPGFEPRQKE